jgi:hypothetical protein
MNTFYTIGAGGVRSVDPARPRPNLSVKLAATNTSHAQGTEFACKPVKTSRAEPHAATIGWSESPSIGS